VSEIPARHWPVGVPFVGMKPGDYLLSDEGIDAKPGTPAKWLRFACPRGRGECSVPLSPQKTSKGHTWKWDGNRERPTLTPSINCLSHDPQTGERFAGCGWHGHITGGRFTNV
jgi:uncharacterized protein DUF6527